MSAYMPSEAWVLAVLGALLLLVLVGGHVLAWTSPTRVARAVAWTALVSGTWAWSD